MKRAKLFFINASGLALVNIFLRCIGVSFNAYVSSKIGAESMGLFTLVMSVYGLAVTVAVSGVNLAAVRLTAERTAVLCEMEATPYEYKKCIRSVARSCILYSLLFGLVTGGVLFQFSDIIGTHVLGDERTVLSLKALSVSLPAISLTTALAGFFTGIRKVYKNAAASILEQAMKIIFTSTALTVAVPQMLDSVEYACLAVVGGSAISEALSLIVCSIMYAFDSKRPAGSKVSVNPCGKVPKTSLGDVAGISLPVAVGAYARQGLVTAEHIAIPWGMKKNGLSASAALASYGVLHGMVFPLILFPSAVLGSFAGLLVPELAECTATADRERINSIVKRVFSASLTFSIGVSAVFFAFSGELGNIIYNSAEAASQIRIVAPLIPVMYFDTVVDGMLKGLGEQLHSMKINIIDAASSLLLVLILVPAFAIKGYIITIYFCEILNAVLSVKRLYSVTKVKIDAVYGVLVPVVCAIISLTVCRTVSFISSIGEGSSSLSLRIIIFTLLYIGLSYITKNTRGKRRKWNYFKKVTLIKKS